MPAPPPATCCLLYPIPTQATPVSHHVLSVGLLDDPGCALRDQVSSVFALEHLELLVVQILRQLVRVRPGARLLQPVFRVLVRTFVRIPLEEKDQGDNT